jgi:hypothetical protein
MSNNRSSINEYDIIRAEQLLDKGIPLIPLLAGKYQVKEGFKAVLLEGGTFKEILEPGFYRLTKYKMFRDLQAVLVDCRMKQLEVKTNREFTIQYPVPIQIELNFSVEYQVREPRRVVLEITSPLATLYDRVIQATRNSISNTHIDEIRTQGDRLSQNIRQSLVAMQLPRTIGIEVVNVFITTIKALDTMGDALGDRQAGRYETVQDWQLESMIAANSRITPEWLAMNRPELYAQIMAGNTQIITELIDKGLMDPAGFLNQPMNAQPNNPNQMWQMLNNPMGMLGGGPSGNVGSAYGGFPGNAAPQIGAGGADNPNAGPSQPSNVQRMNEEISMLKNNLAGARVDTKAGANENGIPDGSYNLRVEVPRTSGGNIICYIVCPSTYPNKAPIFSLEVDGEDVFYEPSLLTYWKPQQYLLELVREAIRYVG